MTLRNCSFYNNTASGDGGAIYQICQIAAGCVPVAMLGEEIAFLAITTEDLRS